jgi:hypothetical protein
VVRRLPLLQGVERLLRPLFLVLQASVLALVEAEVPGEVRLHSLVPDNGKSRVRIAVDVRQ